MDLLLKSTKLRLELIPEIVYSQEDQSIGILFSGGVDSTLLAAFAHLSMPESVKIDLLTVTFQSNSPDLLTSIVSYYELLNMSSYSNGNLIDAKSRFRLIIAEGNIDDIDEEKMKKLIYPKRSHMDFNIASALNIAAQGKGRVFNPEYYESENF